MELSHVKIIVLRVVTSVPGIPVPDPDATTNALSGTVIATSITHPHPAARSTAAQAKRINLNCHRSSIFTEKISKAHDFSLPLYVFTRIFMYRAPEGKQQRIITQQSKIKKGEMIMTELEKWK